MFKTIKSIVRNLRIIHKRKQLDKKYRNIKILH